MRGDDTMARNEAAGRTLPTPLPPVSERLIIRRPKPVEETHELGAYALAVISGTAGNGDIFPEAEDIQEGQQ